MKKSLISAIKKLLTKLGAQEIEGNNLVEVIDNGAEAIEGGSGSGGAKMLTLYTNSQTGTIYAYKDENCTEGYNYAEAETALKNADVIKVYVSNGDDEFEGPFFPYQVVLRYGSKDDYDAAVRYIEWTGSGSFSVVPVHLAYRFNR